MNLVLAREAEADVEEAFRWYEARRAGLGGDFIAQVDAAFQRVLEAPKSFPVAHRGLRRVALRRFPHLVYFREVDDAVQVFGVLHGRRDRSPLRGRAASP